MIPKESTGRILLLTLIGAWLSIDLTLTFYDLIFLDGGLLIPGMVRFILSSALLFMLYKGHSWARWIAIALWFVAAIIFALQLLLLSLTSFWVAVLIAMIVLSSIMVGGLLFSKTINSFLLWQKNRRIHSGQ